MKASRIQFMILLGIVAVSLQTSVLSQGPDARRLTKKDVVIRLDRPPISLCVEQSREKLSRIRIHNNTVWTLRFTTTSSEGGRRMYTLSNGKKVAAQSDGSVFSPRYYLYENPGELKSNSPVWPHGGNTAWLPSGSSAFFDVPTESLNAVTLSLYFGYEWESDSVVGPEIGLLAHQIFMSARSSKTLLDDHGCE